MARRQWHTQCAHSSSWSSVVHANIARRCVCARVIPLAKMFLIANLCSPARDSVRARSFILSVLRHLHLHTQKRDFHYSIYFLSSLSIGWLLVFVCVARSTYSIRRLPVWANFRYHYDFWCYIRTAIRNMFSVRCRERAYERVTEAEATDMSRDQVRVVRIKHSSELETATQCKSCWITSSMKCSNIIC